MQLVLTGDEVLARGRGLNGETGAIAAAARLRVGVCDMVGNHMR